MTQIIAIPSALSPESLFPFSQKLRSTPIAENYLLDFTQLGLVEPFGMLFLAAIIRQFIKERRITQGKTCGISVSNFQNKTYASFMGLFQSFGVNHGNEPGVASGSGTYIPLTRLPISRIVRDARDSSRRLQEIIEADATKIATVLTRGHGGKITEALAYSICELMRNVVEHGQASHIWYAAQYWPTKNKVEVAVLDEGIGLVPTLKRNRKLTVGNDQDAIALAIKPGISGIEKPDRQGDGDWANTGYGLYMTESICKRAGSFLLCNYSKALIKSADELQWHDCAFDGVAVRMVIDTEKISGLNHMLQEFRRTKPERNYSAATQPTRSDRQ